MSVCVLGCKLARASGRKDGDSPLHAPSHLFAAPKRGRAAFDLFALSLNSSWLATNYFHTAIRCCCSSWRRRRSPVGPTPATRARRTACGECLPRGRRCGRGGAGGDACLCAAANVEFTTSFYNHGDPLAGPESHLHLKVRVAHARTQTYTRTHKNATRRRARTPCAMPNPARSARLKFVVTAPPAPSSPRADVARC